MKILIISDSHGLTDELQTIAKRHAAEVDMMIHCGDSELETNHPALEGYKVVKGNCDFMGDFEEELLLPLDGGGKLFLTHGHLHGIKQSLLQVYYRAEELGADIICFGHSHIPGSELLRGKLLINPGNRAPAKSAQRARLCYTDTRWKRSKRTVFHGRRSRHTRPRKHCHIGRYFIRVRHLPLMKKLSKNR